MADYWKSNERKYCDFCKCWISDNKASIAFHESGKRHKLNVAKRITDISRNSEKAERERQKVDAEIRKMEDAAMRAYAQDINARGDFTARSITAVMDAKISAGATSSSGTSFSSGASTSSSARQKQIDPMRLPGNSDDEDDRRVTVQKVATEEVPNASLWVESRSDDGHSYYWNVKTNESVWEAPKEGFLSWSEYQRINEIALKQQDMQKASEAKHFRDNVNEEVARYNRERLKAFRKPETVEEKESRQERKNAFKTEEEAGTQEIGAWQTVETKPPPAAIDWELPKVNNYYPPAPVVDVPAEPPVKRFKEKTIGQLDPELASDLPTSFKKRKFAAKGNARRRLDDD